eukprot:129651_1
MDSFSTHSAFDRSHDNKTVISTAHSCHGTIYGSQIIESNIKAIWRFDIRKHQDKIRSCAIGLVESSQTNDNRFFGLVIDKYSSWSGFKILETDGQYYCYRNTGHFFSSGSQLSQNHTNKNATEYGAKDSIIMELSSGILKFGRMQKKNNYHKLSKWELKEAFKIDSSKKYKLGVHLSGKGEIEIVESSFQSFTSWKKEQMEKMQQEEKEEYNRKQERIELEKIAKMEKTLQKKAKKTENIELNLNEQELRRYKINQKIQSNHNWTTLLTVLIALFSAIGSIALTDSLGLGNQENGSIAVGMGCLSLFVAICKIYISWTATFILSTDSDDLEENYKNMWKSYALKMKAIAVFIATITDVIFDVFQGIAAVQNQKYTNNAFFVLVVSTWIGVADEVVECFVEIFFMSLQEIEKCEISFCIGFLLWSITESVMGCYLLSTYDDEMLRLIGVSIETNLIIFSILFMVLFIYWSHTKKKFNTVF